MRLARIRLGQSAALVNVDAAGAHLLGNDLREPWFDPFALGWIKAGLQQTLKLSLSTPLTCWLR